MEEGSGARPRSIPGAILLLTAVAILACPRSACAQDPNEAAATAEAAGWRAFESGDLPAAEAAFTQARDLGRASAHRGLAEVRRRRGDHGGAAAEFRILLAAEPKDRALRFDLASCLQSDPATRAESVAIYRELLAEKPDDVRARLELGLVLSWEGEHDQAAEELERLLEQPLPDDLRRKARQGLADDYAWSGRRHRARDLYEELLSEQEDAAARKGLNDLERWEGRRAAAGERPGVGAFARFQYFNDTSDWRRMKSAAGATIRTALDLTIDAGVEHAWFEDASGADVQRVSAITRATWRPDTFVRLEGEFDAGAVEGGRGTVAGGLLAAWKPVDGLDGFVRWRHDALIDFVSPFEDDRYNIASTVSILRGSTLDADLVQGGLAYDATRWLKLAGQAGTTWIHDGNRRLEIWLAAEGVLVDSPAGRVALRASYFRVEFDRPSPLYFSPGLLDTYALTLRAEMREGDFKPFVEVSGGWQPSGIDAAAFSGSIGFHADLCESAALEFAVHGLDTAERGGGTRYRALAAILSLTVDF